MTVKCPKCQAENPETKQFCADCGTELPSSRDIHPEVTETLQTPIKELTTGSTFAGRYQIIEELGKGGMGKVYRVLDKKLKEEVALKFIKPEIASDKETIERFSNELKLARKIGHRNVGRMYELMEDEGAHFITMEYVSGEDLKSFIHRVGQLPIGKAISIAKQICDGLAEAHGLGVVHRDLKPSNIMIDKDGNARIMDFGIARSLGMKGMTGAGIMIGTPEYMSPEQVDGREADPRADIYSLGVILFEMLTGRVPFPGDTPFSVALKHKNETPPHPRQANARIPEDLDRVILKCMEKDKEKRYRNAEEMAAELMKIEGSLPVAEKEFLKKITAAGTLGRRPRPLLIGGLAILAVIIIAGGIYLFRRPLAKEKPEAKAEAPSPWKNSIAVLPFVDMSPQKDQGYFCDGMTEELINRLSNIKELRVPARTSAFTFKGKTEDIRDIGRKLDVRTVLEGSIRKAGNQLRITAQLINISDGYHLWSETYDRELKDVFNIWDEISLAVTDKLKLTLLDEEKAKLTKRYTENIDAYSVYLEGKYLYLAYGAKEIERAIRCFEQALQKDPRFILPYSGLADAYYHMPYFGNLPPREAVPMAKAYLKKALDIDENVAETHASLGRIMAFYDWDWKGAERELKRALELNPNSSIVHLHYGHFLTVVGRHEEAVQEAERARELDPLSVSANYNVGEELIYAGQIDKGIEVVKKAIIMNPNRYWSYHILGWAYLKKSMMKESLAAYKKACDLSGEAPISTGGLSIVYYKTGARAEADKLFDSLKERAAHAYVPSEFFRSIYKVRGDLDQAYKWLEKACEDRDLYLPYNLVDPNDDLRIPYDQRSTELLKKVGLIK